MRTKFINCLSLQANLSGSKSDKEETKGKQREEKELLYRKRQTDKEKGELKNRNAVMFLCWG